VQGNLDQIKQAAQQLNAVLATKVNLDNTRPDPVAPLMQTRALSPGNGVDNSGVCGASSGYAQYHWFPLRNFVSPVKDQGKRGTCWAFAAIGAVESRERVQNDNPADLSEQFLVNKVKLEWYPDYFVDGGSAADALNAAVDRNQPLMPETLYTYNKSAGRAANMFDVGVAGTAASYKGVCAEPQPGGYNKDFCSETSHQSQLWCIPTPVLGFDYCAYYKTSFNGPGVAASHVRRLWTNGETFDRDSYRDILSSGFSLIATFPVYEGFINSARKAAPETGIVSDYGKQKIDKGVLVDGTYGSHVAQIIGFLSNEELTFPGSPVNAGGGGYFIIRNSWGCVGDGGGYYYVPADYVSSLFTTLDVPEFDSRRSARWNAEQVTPGGMTGLAIAPGGSIMEDLRVQDNLAHLITVSHPTANYVQLTVTSDIDGTLFNGQWLVNGVSLFANTLPVNFRTLEPRKLTITARYGTQVVSTTMNVTVGNMPPVIGFDSTGTPQQNENFVVNAVVTDINEASPAAMCAAMTWSVSAPDTIVSGSGCMRVINFGATGDRTVTATTQDSEGSTATAIGTFTVSPPPVNPYPRITTFGVYSRDSSFSGNLFLGCTQNAVANDTVIDLRQTGCTASIFGTAPPRYLSKLVIVNPTAEVLSYDWTYSVYSAQGTLAYSSGVVTTAVPSYDMTAGRFGWLDTAYTCTLDVRVNASDPSRSKTLRVWTGQCINWPDVVR
jgi:C1A family cysteine protease